MKKILMPVLALVLCASAAFAGLTRTPSADSHTEYASLNNVMQSNRTFSITVTCEGETVSDSFLVTPGIPESAYYEGEEAKLPQRWSVKVTDESGAPVTSATLSYDGTNFHPGQIGDGLVFEIPGPYSVKLIVTK